MDIEYFALIHLEKSSGRLSTEKIPPKLFEYKTWLSEKLISNESVEAMINHLISNGWAEYQQNDRIGFTDNGYKYLDEKYWLEQVYEMVDTGLKKILNRNDWIKIRHVRGNHKIQQKVVSLLENKLTKNLSTSSNKMDDISLLEITETGREVILEFDLAQAQKKDIPVNAEDRKTVITWQIIAGVLAIVVFLLKLFGVKGWL